MRSPQLTPLKQRIYDLVKVAGAEGITAADIVRRAYEGRGRFPDRKTVKSHVSQINDWLATTNEKICSDGYRTGGRTPRYRLVHRRAVERRKAKQLGADA